MKRILVHCQLFENLKSILWLRETVAKVSKCVSKHPFYATGSKKWLVWTWSYLNCEECRYSKSKEAHIFTRFQKSLAYFVFFWESSIYLKQRRRRKKNLDNIRKDLGWRKLSKKATMRRKKRKWADVACLLDSMWENKRRETPKKFKTSHEVF